MNRPSSLDGMVPARRKRGRPRGSQSWWKNPVNVARHHANGLLELWLATAPVRRYTVPPKIKRRLCEAAIDHLEDIHRKSIEQGIPSAWKRPDIEQVLAAVNRRAPDGPSLRRKAARRKLRK